MSASIASLPSCDPEILYETPQAFKIADFERLRISLELECKKAEIEAGTKADAETETDLQCGCCDHRLMQQAEHNG